MSIFYKIMSSIIIALLLTKIFSDNIIIKSNAELIMGSENLMYNILEYGAVNDGKTNSAGFIQKAVDECSKNGGGVIYVPYGKYVMSSVHIYDNIHFVFEPGTLILGSLNPDDFDKREEINYPLYQDCSHSYFRRSLFWAEDCENISFCGNATIDMREVWENTPVPNEIPWVACRANKIISLKNCKNVLISDLKMFNATDLAVYMAGCENVRITGLTMQVNIDGISPDCCKNVIISDCNVVAGDDGIVLKTSYALNEKKACESITISNCIVSSRMCAIKFGTETNGDFRNISVSNCSIYDTCLTGVALEIADGGIMDGISISGITMQNVGTPFIIMLTNRANGPKGTTIGKIKNIIIDNLTAIGSYGPIKPIKYTTIVNDDELEKAPIIVTSSVVGQPDSFLENITLSNINMTLPGGGTAEDRNIVVPEISDKTPSASAFGTKLPSYGIYFRYVKNLVLNNINIHTLRDDKRECMVFDNVYFM